MTPDPASAKLSINLETEPKPLAKPPSSQFFNNSMKLEMANGR